MPDTTNIDVMIGYRADDSYFSFAEDFVNNTISLHDLNFAMQIENGNLKYLAGKSDLELFIEVTEKTDSTNPPTELCIETYDRSPAYWVGWMLSYYQWYSCRTFKNILDTVPYTELLGLYKTLHEADILKSYEVMDAHFAASESKLKTVRKKCGLTQSALAEKSGVSLNTIRAYECKNKDLNKAQLDIIMCLSKSLKCNISDLLE